MKTILLTGASGFLGSHLLENFIKKEYTVIALIRSTSDLWRIEEFLPKCKIYKINEIDLNAIFQTNKIDLVVHTACSYGRKGENSLSIVESNLIFGLNIFEAAKKHKVKTFINTDTLLPKEVNPYSLSKSQFREWLKMSSDEIQIINMRIEHMYGPRDDKNKFIVWLIFQMYNSENLIELTSGIQKRNFIYIDDVISAFNLLVQKSNELEKYNSLDIATNKLTEVREFVEIIAKEIEKRKGKSVMDKLKFGAKEYRKNDIMQPEYSTSKINQLGWIPTVDVEEGIHSTLNYYL
jgi:CDP-paratose synthetase